MKGRGRSIRYFGTWQPHQLETGVAKQATVTHPSTCPRPAHEDEHRACCGVTAAWGAECCGWAECEILDSAACLAGFAGMAVGCSAGE